jgi:hypothetical protein
LSVPASILRPVANLQAVYYRAPDGSELANEFFDRLPVKRQVALDNQIDRLNMLAPSARTFPSRTARRSRASFAS